MSEPREFNPFLSAILAGGFDGEFEGQRDPDAATAPGCEEAGASRPLVMYLIAYDEFVLSTPEQEANLLKAPRAAQRYYRKASEEWWDRLGDNAEAALRTAHQRCGLPEPIFVRRTDAPPASAANALINRDPGDESSASIHAGIHLEAELRPPPEHADKRWHWLEHNGQPTVAGWAVKWDGGWWTVSDDYGAPDYMAQAGYRYLGPAEPPDKSLNPYDPDSQLVLVVRAEDNRKNQRIAELEAENAQLRTLLDAERMSSHPPSNQRELEAENARLREDLRTLMASAARPDPQPEPAEFPANALSARFRGGLITGLEND